MTFMSLIVVLFWKYVTRLMPDSACLVETHTEIRVVMSDSVCVMNIILFR